MSDSDSLSAWIAHVFDHPVAPRDQAWYWADDPPVWEGSSECVASLIVDTFERSGELLARFTDEQLNQGFWYLVSSGCSDFMFALIDEAVPWATRLCALRSFVPLFEQVMAVRCSPHLSHLDEKPANPLNAACYMWWDIIPIYGKPDEPARAEFDAEVLRILTRLLAIPHDACRESALHGISHWQMYYPGVESVVDEFLACTPGLRPELINYAHHAKMGMVQ